MFNVRLAGDHMYEKWLMMSLMVSYLDCPFYHEMCWMRSGTESRYRILCIGTDRSQQTVQTKIRLQSDQDLRCLPFNQHLLEALMQCYIKLFYF